MTSSLNNTTTQPIIAICYDFDGTLSPGNMQEYSFIPTNTVLSKEDFWKKSNANAKLHNSDTILSYMKLMLDEATTDTQLKLMLDATTTKSHKEVSFTRDDLVKGGKKIDLFPGVEDWFQRITAYANERHLTLEHYIISSGLKPMIEGRLPKEIFEHIFASEFYYSDQGIPEWPAIAINYTTKTQYLFRINKGVLDSYNDKDVNKYVEDSMRRIPFTNMVYIGDGDTDIPAMKMINFQGGHSIAVYKDNNPQSLEKCQELRQHKRCKYIAKADYSPNEKLERIVKNIIDSIHYCLID